MHENNEKNEPRVIREKVSANYAERIESQQCCCGPDAEKNEVPSFGCGDPLAFAGVQPGETVLDLGSGAGHDLLVAAKAVGKRGRVIGVDMTDAMLAAARENTRDQDNIELRKGIIEDLPVEEGSVDWVISNCVINLSPQKARVFAEIARVLKPGGRFSISDMVAEDLPDWLRSNEAAYAACVSGAVSESEYLAGLAAAGLTDVEVTSRHLYETDELCAMGRQDFGIEIDPAQLGNAKVSSIRVTGRRQKTLPAVPG